MQMCGYEKMIVEQVEMNGEQYLRFSSFETTELLYWKKVVDLKLELNDVHIEEQFQRFKITHERLPKNGKWNEK